MTPPTKDSKQPGSWKEDVQRILMGYENECRWDSLGEVVNEGAKFLSFEEALQAIIEANKKWLIKDEATYQGNKYQKLMYRNELREEQRKAME